MDERFVGMTAGRSNQFIVTPALQQELIESFNIDHPQYLKANCANFVNEPNAESIDLHVDPNDKWWSEDVVEITKKVSISTKQEEFLNFQTFHYLASFHPEKVHSFIDEFIRGKRVMFIGCRTRDQMQQIFGPIAHYVQTPETNSYASIDLWWPIIEAALDSIDVVIPASGFSSRVVNKRIWDLGTEIHSIDVGSFIDPACGVVNRTWTKYALKYIYPNFRERLL
jgi:hypothetical protein